MGRFFTNLQVKRTENIEGRTVEEAVTAFFEKQGYHLVQSSKQADGMLIVYAPADSDWISVYSDLIELNLPRDVKAIASPLSLSLNTDILAISCFDSDYLFMNLINSGDRTDAWVNVGRVYGDEPPRKDNFAGWENKVNNIFAFQERMKKNYTFAEDALDAMEDAMGLPIGQALFMGECKGEEEAMPLYFAMKQSGVQELPKLKYLFFELIPCIPEESSYLCVYNDGGASVGIRILIWGDYDFVKQEEITFSDVSFEYRVGKQRQSIPITLEKRKLENGNYAYVWEDENFRIPPKPNPNLSVNKNFEVASNRSFGIRFTPHGNNRKFLDIRVDFVPYGNEKNGRASWYVWENCSSKREYIEGHNYQSQKTVFANVPHFQLPFPENRLGQINPDDYDL